MSETTDLDRLRLEYANRELRLSGRSIYSSFNLGYLFTIQQRQRTVLRVLGQAGFTSLSSKYILEVGCGSGGVLLEYLTFGARPEALFGIDLLHSRLLEAHHRSPLSGVNCADGQSMPFPDAYFDLVLQYTAFSSILDEIVKINVAHEMLRVLKPGGAVLWYDFWFNPINHQTRGIRPAEIRRLFPNCTYKFLKITLAPPIARRLAPRSWGLTLFLENLQMFNSHYLALIYQRPKTTS